jgi:hypothetical protein
MVYVYFYKKYFLKQIYPYDFYIFKPNNLTIIHNLYF